MTSTEVATVHQHRQRSALALTDDQTWWTERQLAGLAQIGIADAPDGDKLVFLHVAQKTGLDPFARQIHMVSRNQRDGDRWVKKWTIQTGIDGYRLIADRADRRDGTAREYDDTLWADADGNWTDLWTKGTAPTAAKVTVYRSGRKFSAVAMFREYVQTKRDGEPNSMWERMPANQLAKCAEAAALRKAYPQDLSGLYTDDEMGQADRPTARQVTAPEGNGAERLAAVLDDNQPDASDKEPVDAEVVDDTPKLDMRSSLAKAMFATIGEAGVPEDRHHEYLSKVLGRDIASRKDLTEADARIVIDATREVLDNPEGQS